MSATIWIDLTVLALLLAPITAAAQFGPGAPSVVRGRPLTATPPFVIPGGQTYYLQVGGSDTSGSVTEVQLSVDAGTYGGMWGLLTDAPGAGEDVTLTLQSGTCGTALADSAVTVTISDTDTLERAPGGVTVGDGACLAIKAVYSAGATPSRPRVTIYAY